MNNNQFAGVLTDPRPEGEKRHFTASRAVADITPVGNRRFVRAYDVFSTRPGGGVEAIFSEAQAVEIVTRLGAKKQS